MQATWTGKPKKGEIKMRCTKCNEKVAETDGKGVCGKCRGELYGADYGT
jgi:Zn finger protein HypA/HybF involved in hydrogenase expression